MGTRLLCGNERTSREGPSYQPEPDESSEFLNRRMQQWAAVRARIGYCPRGMWDKLKLRARKTGTDYGLLVPLLLNSLVGQTIISIVRITTTYRAVELGLSVVALGVITAAFALLPIFIAVWVGRFTDRGHDALAAWIGGGLISAGCLGFVVWPSAVGLFLATTVLGIGHLFLVI